MKFLIHAVAIAVEFAAPVVSFAQQSNNAPVSRARVGTELVQLEKARYQPGRDGPHYPVDI